MIWFKFEEAVKILIKYFPEEPMKKPTLFHSIRVGSFLWTNNYSEDIQIAGLLHDALEDTDIPESVISDNFWIKVLNIVKVNSENNNLEKSKILEDIVFRCSDLWEDALIVKMADIYDNFLFYVKEQNYSEFERCKKLSLLVQKYKKDSCSDKIFNKIDEILSYTLV